MSPHFIIRNRMWVPRPQQLQKHRSTIQTSPGVTLHPAGDFFTEEVPPADLYILARVIHDWPEEKCLTLLNKLCRTCSPGQCAAARLWRLSKHSVSVFPPCKCSFIHQIWHLFTFLLRHLLSDSHFSRMSLHSSLEVSSDRLFLVHMLHPLAVKKNKKKIMCCHRDFKADLPPMIWSNSSGFIVACNLQSVLFSLWWEAGELLLQGADVLKRFVWMLRLQYFSQKPGKRTPLFSLCFRQPLTKDC